MERKQRLAVMVSTGSIGTQTLDIVRNYPDRFEITTLTANNQWQVLAEQAREVMPDSGVIANDTYYTPLKEALSSLPIKVYAGNDALEQVVCSEAVDTVVMALVGYSGLFPTVSALKHGKKVALANKECLVVAGEIVTALSAKHRAPILPVDSEHSAIFQCLVGEHSPIDKIILTASGGPFLHKTAAELEEVSIADALNHPYWNMGAKVTIDSASLMNKGFEVIEARWLFDLRPEQTEVVIHPPSVIHSMVQFADGAIKAQLGTPDMHLPIQYALCYPQRRERIGKPLDFKTISSITFEQPDMETFRGLKLAYETGKIGGSLPTVFNAANERSVALFLQKKISYLTMADIIEEACQEHQVIKNPSLDEILAVEQEVYQKIDQKFC